jgi:CYTH domain-containing protein
VVPDAGYNWEIDEFLDRKLFLAEVELEDESRTPAIPRWLRSYVVREVTEESRYVNLKLAR